MTKATMAYGSTFGVGDSSNASGTPAVITLTCTGTPTGGSFNFTVPIGFNSTVQPNTGPTLNVAYNATTSTLQTSLDALFNIGKNASALSNTVAGGGPWPGSALTVTFQNDLNNRVIPNFIAGVNALTGGSSPAATSTLSTPGVAAGATYTNIAEMLTMPFPAVKRAKKEMTNFDSTNFTKEFIPEFIDPGDVKIDANYTGDTSQDWLAGMIYKFNQGLTYPIHCNIPHYQTAPGVFRTGHLESFNAFFTEASINNAKVTDALMISGTLGVTGALTYSRPL